MRGTGVEVWTKEAGGRLEDLGPFDDEETRAFYCDIPVWVNQEFSLYSGTIPHKDCFHKSRATQNPRAFQLVLPKQAPSTIPNV